MKKIIALVMITISFSFTNPDKKIVVIDASHGGKDSGTFHQEFMEKDIALQIAKKIKRLNKNANIKIILTRDSDEFMGLQKRAKFINELNPDLVISLHANYGKDEALNGTEIYISDDNKEKEKSREHALEMKTAFKEQNAEVKKSNFFLLRNVNHPSVFLEIGYLSNNKDRTLMTTEEGQTQIAENILSLL